MKTYKVYVAAVKVKQVANWLVEADVEGATITKGKGYWEGVLEKQVTVELGNVSPDTVQAFIAQVFEHTKEQAVYVVCTEVNYAQDVHRTQGDLFKAHKNK